MKDSSHKGAGSDHVSASEKSTSTAIIFGLKDYPRPKHSGFFYCRPTSLFGDFAMKTLAVLDLFNTDRDYLNDIINKGIESLLEDEDYADKKEYYLTHYSTENMKPFVQNILKQVIETKLLSKSDM